MLQKPPHCTHPVPRKPEVRKEHAGGPGSFTGDQAPGVPREAVGELKVIFNPKEICSCGHLQNDGAHVIRGCGRGGRVTFPTRCSREGDARAALPGFGRRPVLLSLPLEGKFGCVQGRRLEPSILFCLKSYSFKLSPCDSSK